MRLRFAVALALVGILAAQHGESALRAEEKRLAVSGSARVEQRPDVMEIAVNVSAGGHMTADALKKFRSNRRRGVEAINKLKIKGLEVKGSGISVVSSALVQQFRQRFGNMQQGSDGDTNFSETLTFVVPAIDRLTDEQVQDLVAKILDAAKDAGLTLGFPNDQNPYVYNYNSFRPQVVFFRVADAEAVRQKALDLAAKDARSKAEQMAKRLNLTIGNPVTVRDSSSRQFNVNRQVVNAGNSDSASAESSPTLHNMTIEAVVNVEYEIVK
jgi:uncharacterized protein YggE